MAAYRPKTIFQSNSADREAWQQMAGSPLLHRAIAYAQADMAFAGFGPHEMLGATALILALLNLSENEDQKKPLPIRRLTSYDEQPTVTVNPGTPQPKP